MRYNTPNTPSDQLREFFLRGQIPVTLTLLGANLLTFLAAFFFPRIVEPFLLTQMVFTSDNVLRAPWTVLTYPLVSVGFSLWMIVMWVFFWLSGGSLERGWGSRRFAAFFSIVTVLSALSLFAGGLLTHTGVPLLNDIFLPLTGLIVAFCMLNPEQQIMLYFIPVRAKYVALIVTAFNFFTYGSLYRNPFMGLFACGGILAAYLYVRFARPWADISSYSPRSRPAGRGPDLRIYPSSARFNTRAAAPMDGSPPARTFDLAARWNDYKERRRLEKLWKNSGFTDPEPSWRDDDRRR